MRIADVEDRIGTALAGEYGCDGQREDLTRQVRAIVASSRAKFPDEAALVEALEAWEKSIAGKKREHKKIRAAVGDLRWWLNENRPERARLIRLVSDHTAQAFAVVGVLTAAILRVSYDQFYEPFGLTPEEVGFSSAQILAFSLPGTLAVLLLLTVVLGLLWLPQTAMAAARRDRAFKRVGEVQPKQPLMAFWALVALNVLAGYLLLDSDWLEFIVPTAPSDISSTALGAMVGAIGGTFGGVIGASTIGAAIYFFCWRFPSLLRVDPTAFELGFRSNQ